MFAASADTPPGFVPNTMLIRNSTIADNTSAGSGGGSAASTSAASSCLRIAQSAATLPKCSVAESRSIRTRRRHHAGNSIVSGNRTASAPDIQSPYLVNAFYSAIGSTEGFALCPASANNSSARTSILVHCRITAAQPKPSRQVQLLRHRCRLQNFVPIDLTSDQRGIGYFRKYGNAEDIGRGRSATR